jgi:putative DNA primase/helicase
MIDWTDFSEGNHRVRCPSCGRNERDKSAGLTIASNGRGVLHCFRCAYVESYKPDADTPPQAPRLKPRHQPQGAKHASLSEWGRDLWRDCQPISGVAAQYLRHRHCLIPPESGHLRWHGALKHPSGYVGPALVALITDIHTGQHLSLHRTWVTPTGKANIETPRLPLWNHSTKGGCIRLWPDEGVTLGLGIAEGIETALSLAWAYAPVWATIDAGHISRFPVLDGIETLVIAQDQDPAGMTAASICSRRWAEAGREVLVTRQAANDLNDMLCEVAA